MKITPERTVGEIAAVYPETAQVFELKGIDYCCGGKRTLEAVCQIKNLNTARLIQNLEKIVDKSPDRAATWTDAPLTELIHHLISSTLSIRLHSKRHGRGRKTVGAGFSSHGGGNGM